MSRDIRILLLLRFRRLILRLQSVLRIAVCCGVASLWSGFFFFFSPSALAASFQNTYGLSVPHVTVTFGEHILPDGTGVVSQYADLGLSFFPFAYYFSSSEGMLGSPNFSGPIVTSFTPGGAAPGLREIKFAQIQTAVALAFATYPQTTLTLQARLKGAVVETAVFVSGSELPNDFYGFTGIEFDSVSVTTNAWPAWAIDNIQMPTGIQPCGDGLKFPCSLNWSVGQGTQASQAVQLINPGAATQSATIEVVNPHSGLGIAVSGSNAVTVPAGTTNEVALSVNADSASVGTYTGILLKISSTDGISTYANLAVRVTPPGAPPLPDLAISSDDIGSTINSDGSVTVTANVHNLGSAAASNVAVQFYDFDNPIGSATIQGIAPKESPPVAVTVPAMTAGDHLIRVVVDPARAIQETDETNNEASRLITIGSASPTAGGILVTGSLPTTVYANSVFTLGGNAAYELIVNGTRYTDYVVKGGSVKVTIKQGQTGPTWEYGEIYTDTGGNFTKGLQAPSVPGTYQVTMTVTDKTFVGTRDLVFDVVTPPAAPEPPPLPPPVVTGGAPGTGGTWTYDPPSDGWTWVPPPGAPTPQPDLSVVSKDIFFSRNNPAAQEETTVFAKINYWAPSTAQLAQDVLVNIYARLPGSERTKIGQTTIPRLSVGSPDFGSRYVYATWKNPGEGIYLIEFEIDPSYTEAYMGNNSATRAIIVAQPGTSTPGVVSGQVTSVLGGMADVVVHLLRQDGTEIGNPTITDATGFYYFRNVSADAVQVRIDAPSGYAADAATKPGTVADRSVTTVDFQLKAVATDTTPPVITPLIVGNEGSNGWYRGDVTVTWGLQDPESAISARVGCDQATVASDTAGETLTCSATSAGGTASRSVTIKRDATPPTIAAGASPSANANGWSNTPVAVSFVCTDAMAGVASCPGQQTLSTQGANQTASGTATDNAGNAATASVTGISIDLTPPQVAVTGVENGKVYPQGSVPAAGCTTSDPLSGVQQNATLQESSSISGGVRTYLVECVGARDNAGNTGAARVTYTVNAPAANVPFSSFSASGLRISQKLKTVLLLANVTLGTASNGINPLQEAIGVRVGRYAATIPAGSMRAGPRGTFAYAGKIDNVSLEVLLVPLGSNRYTFQLGAYGADWTGTTNPVAVELSIGDDRGSVAATGTIQ
jgi:hypothetical protein